MTNDQTGYAACLWPRMKIKNLDDLEVFQLSGRVADEISALLNRSGIQTDFELRDQLATCSARIPSNIGEGFGQKTDRHCAHYQYIARGSCNEMRGHLGVACGRNYITTEERDALTAKYIVIGKKLTRWIQHLEREDRKRRG